LSSIPHLFLRRCATDPERVALRAPSETLTYRELDDRSARIAVALRQRGIGAGDRVGVSVGRRPEVVPCVLGVLRAGAAYVPIDPGYPPARVALMVEDAGLRARIVIDGEGLQIDDLLASEGVADPAWLPDPESLAYVVYTSGSTGRPKGVCVHQRSVLNLLAATTARLGLCADDTLLSVVSLSFDLSVFDLFAPLSVGASLVVAEPQVVADGHALARWMDRFGVSFLQATPATFRLLLGAGWTARAPVTFLNGGEALPPDLVGPILDSGCTLWNGYGPAEATVCATLAPVTDPSAPVTIGTPLDGVSVHLLDPGRRPVADGAEGEIWLGGVQLASAYHQRPEQTTARFCEVEPFGRLYRTGDLGCVMDGELHFRGRADFQLKIRGHRVEPGEVEAALNEHPDVYACAVGARPGPGGELALVGWVVPRGEAVEVAALRAWLGDRLPAYLVPSAWVVLDALPLSPSGKIDRLELPAPDASAASDDPQTPISEAFAVVLGRPSVGLHDDFFDLGGHSLAAARLTARLRESLGVDLPLSAVFEAPTVAELTARLRELERPLPPLLPAERTGPLPASSGQRRLFFLSQATDDLPYRTPLVVDLEGPLSIPSVEAALDALVARHEPLRTTLHGLDGACVQSIAAEVTVPLEAVDALLRPFDLSRDPALRASLVRLSPEHHQLRLTIHHVAFDGASLAVLQADLADLLAGRTPAPLPLAYADWAAWEARNRSHERTLADRAWWVAQLAGSPRLALPGDRPRPERRRPEAHVAHFECPPEVSAALHRLGRAERVTPFMALLGAFTAFFARRTGQWDLPIATPVAHRTHRETEGLIGFFANTIVLRVPVTDGGFREHLRVVRGVVTDAFARAHVSLDLVVPEVAPGQSDQPLAQVCFVAQDTPPPPASAGPLRVTVREATPAGAPFDLTVQVWDEGGIRGTLIGRADLFDDATLEALAVAWVDAARDLLSDGGVPPIADAQEPDVRALPGVADAVVGACGGPDGRVRRAAWILPDGTRSWASLEREIRGLGPVAIPVAAVPLRDGRVDRAALSRVEPVGPGRLEPIQVPAAPLALSSLLPSWSRILESPPPRTSVGEEPAEAHGAPLRFAQGAPRTLPAALRAAALGDAGLRTIELDGAEHALTYAALLDRAERGAADLRAAGVAPGCLVVLQLRRNIDFVVGLWAGLLAGCVVIPIAAPPSYEGGAGKLDAALGLGEEVRVLGDGETVAELAARGVSALELGVLDAPPARLSEPDPEDLCLLLLTSGSTGRPKAVRHCHRSVLSQAEGYCAWHGFDADSVFLNWLPLDHVGGLFMNHVPAIWRGAVQIHAPTALFLEAPTRWLDWIERFGATYTWAPNFAFALVADAWELSPGRGWDLSSLRVAMNGGEAVLARTARRFLALGASHGLSPDALVPAWGMSELASCSTSSLDFRADTSADTDAHVCVGHPQPGFAVRIVDEAGAVLRWGERGRLLCRGPSVTDGYHLRPDLDVAFADGWFDTGDLAYIDARGLWITGRAKDEIIVRGINFRAQDLEACAEDVEGVARSFVAAIPVRDAGSGTERVALVLSTDAADEAACLTAVRRAIARAHALDVEDFVVVPRARIPKTEIGKIQRARLAADLRAGAFEAERSRTRGLLGAGEALPQWFWARRWVPRDLRAGPSVASDVLTLVWDEPPGPELASVARSTAVRGLRALQDTARRGGRLAVVTRGAACVGDEAPDPRPAALLGVLAAAAVELPVGTVRWVDTDDLGVIEAELAAPAVESEVAWRRGRRLVPRLVPALDSMGPAFVLPPGAPVLVAGGAGGVGRHLVSRLRGVGCQVCLLGRRAGVDLADSSAVERAVRDFEAEHGPLVAVFHLAAVLNDRALMDETEAGIAAIAAARIDGTLELAEIARDRGAPFVDLGSIHGFLGGFGLGAYGAGSRFGAAICAGLRHGGTPAWHLASSSWLGVGLSAERPGDRAATLGYAQIEPAQGVPSLFAALRSLSPVVFVGLDGGNVHLRRHLFDADPRRFRVVEATAPQPARAAMSGATQRAVAAIWVDLLGVEAVGPDDNFFDLGGHSMLIAQLRGRVCDAVGRDVPIVEFFRHPTVRAQARFLDGVGSDDRATSARERAAEQRRRLAARRPRRRRR